MRTNSCSKMILLVPNNNKIKFFKVILHIWQGIYFHRVHCKLYIICAKIFITIATIKVGYCHCKCFCYIVTPRDVSESAVFNFKKANVVVTAFCFYWRIFYFLASMLGTKSRDIRTANTVITIFGFTYERIIFAMNLQITSPAFSFEIFNFIFYLYNILR